MENSWTLMPASAFNLLWEVDVVYEEALGSHRCVLEKGKILFHILRVFIYFLFDFVFASFYFLILPQNLKTDSLLKVSCCVVSKTTSVNFWYPITLKCIGLSCPLFILFFKIYFIDFAITIIPFFSPLYSPLPCTHPLTHSPTIIPSP